MTYVPKVGDRAIVRVKVVDSDQGANVAVVALRSEWRFWVHPSDLEPDLTPEPPKPLAVGDKVKWWDRPGVGTVVWVGDDRRINVLFSGEQWPTNTYAPYFERVPQ